MRLESLGFDRVHDYQAGKMDWLAFGLPIGGSAAAEPTVGGLAREVPTLALDQRLDEIQAGDARDWYAVVDEAGVLLGRVRGRQIEERPGARAVEVMEGGPSTYRPSTPAAEMVETMRRGHFDRAFVTDSDGRLRGLVHRHELEAALPG